MLLLGINGKKIAIRYFKNNNNMHELIKVFKQNLPKTKWPSKCRSE